MGSQVPGGPVAAGPSFGGLDERIDRLDTAVGELGIERIEEARSVAIFCDTRNGGRPISGAKNQATAIAFGGPRSSCVRPDAHSARRQDSRKDLTPRRMALHFVSAGAHAPHSDETLGPTATRGSSVAPRSSLTRPRFPVLLH